MKLKEEPGELVLSLFKDCHVSFAMHGHTPELAVATDTAPYDIVLLEGNGLDTLKTIKESDPRVEVVIIGKATASAVESVKEGASAYFERPLEMKAFKNTVNHILELIQLRQETGRLENILSTKYTFFGIVGKNPRMFEIKNFIRRIAPYYRAVTICGEAGVGKELVARSIHDVGHCSKEPFVVYDCGAVTEQTLMCELFGRGDARGLFVEVDHGTVVLDNIERLPAVAQELLLTVVRDGEFTREDSGKRIGVNAKVVALTEKELSSQSLKTALNEELYRIFTELNLTMPALRDRKDDLLLLTRHFLSNFSERTGKRISGASMPVQNLFMKYDWPGNVRELETLIERLAAATGETFLGLEDLPAEFARLAGEDTETSLSLDDVVRGHISMVFDLCRQDIDKAAELLGLRSSALKKKLESFSLI